jgi:uncharacterized protein (TIGR03437 family)
MSRLATVLAHTVTVLTRARTRRAIASLLLAAPLGAWAQGVPDWYHVGNSLEDLSLAGLATGPVNRVWYSADGGTLYAAASGDTAAEGKTFETSDFERWSASAATAPAPVDLSSDGTNLPESGARLKGFNGQRSTMYAFGAFVYRSDSGGASWDNVTGYQGRSIIGNGVRDLAVSPRDPNEVTASTSAGVFRSMDGGKSWSGLNEGLPNLSALRLWALPSGDRGAQIEVPGNMALEWQPGEKQAWRPVANEDLSSEASARLALDATAFVQIGTTVYRGTQDGRITVYDGTTAPLQDARQNAGRIERFWVDPKDSRIALAVLGARPENAIAGVAAPHVLHTVNGGASWDNITNDLPDAVVRGIAVSQQGRAIYVATDAGVYFTRADASVLSLPSHWQLITGLPQAPVTDVRLDPGETQLWTAVQGYGVYSTLAPHRLDDPSVVSTADLVARAAAPGSLMSVRGAKLSSAQAGGQDAPVLATTDTESQIQIPYSASGSSISLSLAPLAGREIGTLLPLAATSPGILVAVDGSPFLRDANSGTMLDASNPAHPRGRIQILATGLGRVNPDWPAGKPAPADDPPTVAAPVTAYLNGNPVQVTRQVLAPGYTGFYLVEIELPKLVNYGPAQLSIEAGGHASNPVRVYIEP